MKTMRAWSRLIAALLLGVGAGCSTETAPGSEAPPSSAASQALASQEEPYRVMDINIQELGSQPNSAAVINGTVLFVVTTRGRLELWKSDGTQAGTSLVKDLRQQQGASGSVSALTAVGATVFFQDFRTNSLWKSDGTPSGTAPLGVSELPFFFESVAMNGKLYMLASLELWVSDGTAAGTRKVKSFANPDGQVVPLSSMTPIEGKLFFRAPLPDGKPGLWKSDGTEAGTVSVQLGSSLDGQELTSFTTANGRLFFLAKDGSGRPALWSTDGTSAAPSLLHSAKGFGYNPKASGARVYFVAYNETPAPTNELWMSDGTVAGTVLVKQLESYPSDLMPTEGGVLFSTWRSGTGRELWRSDGTEAGTVVLKDLCAGIDAEYPVRLASVGAMTFFSSGCEGEGVEPWRSDGTVAGTLRLRDIYPGSRASHPFTAVAGNGVLYFWAEDGIHGSELWKSDGTTAGTVFVRDVVVERAGSEPRIVRALGDSLLFIADDGLQGQAVWRSDGTEAGTVRLGSMPVYLFNQEFSSAELRGTLYFVAGGTSLWKSDGTVEGTGSLPLPSPGPDQPIQLVSAVATLGGSLIVATGDTQSVSLWKSDGTTAGTVRLRQILTEGYSRIESLVELNGEIYFVVGDFTKRLELWKTNGTEAGTTSVRTLFEHPQGIPASVSPLVSLKGRLFFATGNNNDWNIWRSDGTEAGTLVPSEFSSLRESPENLAVVGEELYVLTIGGSKLWKSDGASPLTLVKTIFPLTDGPGYSYQKTLDVVRGQLHFSTFSQKDGWQIWRSDGTAAGTVRVLRLELGREDYYATAPFASFAEASRRLFFVKSDEQGRELWALPFAPFLCPADVTAEATSAAGAVVVLPVPRRDPGADPSLPIMSSHPPESTIPLGTTEITLTSVDPSFPASTCTYTVEVGDHTPPQLKCDQEVKEIATSGEGARVEFPLITATDAVSTPTLEFSREPGSLFPVGRTVVEVDAKDVAGNTSNCSFTVNVVESSACGCGTASPGALLWWVLALVPVAMRRRQAR